MSANKPPGRQPESTSCPAALSSVGGERGAPGSRMLKTALNENLEPTPLRTYVAVLARRKRILLVTLIVVPFTAIVISLARAIRLPRQRPGAAERPRPRRRSHRSPGWRAGRPRSRRRHTGAGRANARSRPSCFDRSRRPVMAGGSAPRQLGRHAGGRYERPRIQCQGFRSRTGSAPCDGVCAAIRPVHARDRDRGDRAGAEGRRRRTHAPDESGSSGLGVVRQAGRRGPDAPDDLRSADGQGAGPPPCRGCRQGRAAPKAGGVFGLVGAVLLGLGLVALMEALETRVRTENDVPEALGIPLLGRLAEPPRRLRRNSELAVVMEPDGPNAEAFRILRANVEYANAQLGAKTIMLTSCVRGEGKSTTAANMAASFARLGKHVTLVDLDFRRPSVHRNFASEWAPRRERRRHGPRASRGGDRRGAHHVSQRAPDGPTPTVGGRPHAAPAWSLRGDLLRLDCDAGSAADGRDPDRRRRVRRR